MTGERWRLIEGECLRGMAGMEAGSFDAIITDPPYAQTNESYDSDIACRPDVWRGCFRVAKDNAALVAFAGSPTYHRIATAIEAGGWKVRQMWAWVYRDGLITSAYPREGFDRLAPAMTPIVFATKGKVLLKLEREGDPWEVRFRRADRHAEMSERSSANSCRESAAGHWPRSVVSDGTDEFRYFALSHNATNRGGGTAHPNEKPLLLMRWLASKLPGDLILDPFAGSGTTLAAALLEDRRAVGIEQSPEYCAIIRRRLASLEADTPLFAAPVPTTSQPSLFGEGGEM